MSRARVLITTGAESAYATANSVKGLAEYIRQVIIEPVDNHTGKFENLEESVEYMAGILGRLIEDVVLGGVDLRDPRKMDVLIFGSDTKHGKEIKILAPQENDDDIPF